MSRKGITLSLAFILAASLAVVHRASAQDGPLSYVSKNIVSNDFNPFSGQSGFVYTETNGANNAVLVFNRAANSALSLAATVPTGGLGGGVVSVGSQGALALSPDGQWLFAVNEGGAPDGSV